MLRINIPLTSDEMRILVTKAEKQCRSPKDQARYILRSALLGEQSVECSKPVTDSIYQRETVNGFGIGQP